MEENRYYTSKEVASLLNMTTRRVVGLCREGRFSGAVQKGRSWVIPESAIKTYLNIRFGEAFRFAYGRTGETSDVSYEGIGEKAACYGAVSKSQKVLPCPVGNSSYIEISEKCYYVDKTLLIKDLVDNGSLVTLFTRPRRFGKTLAISMLQTFFEKSEEDTAAYFRAKKIWYCGSAYRKLQGAFPVISLSFKDVKFGNWADTFESIKLVLRDEFLRHKELWLTPELNRVEQEYLDSIQSQNLSEVEFSRALLNLCRMLEKVHRSKVIVLIDEYDTPIQMGHTHGFYDEVINFMRNFLSGGLKDNSSLEFGVMTGILRVSKENLFSGLNNPVVNTVLDEKYSEYFGFTEDEVCDMAAYYGQADKMEEIRAWYDGYRFGGREMYNPWSVANYFYNDCMPKAFWANTGDNEIIREILTGINSEIAEELFSIVEGKKIQAFLNTEVIYPQIADGTDTIFSFLLLCGYLRAAGPVTETEFGTFVEMELPNTEVRRVYNTEILSWLKGSLQGNTIAELEKALYLGDGDRLKKSLQKYMVACISSFDTATEGFYHGMMLGLVAGFSSTYWIRSNRESGEGRFDLLLEPKTKSMPGIVMEFKSLRKSEKSECELTELAKTGLAQIKEKHYAAELKERGITDITAYGIAFCGKKVEVAKEDLQGYSV